MKESHHQSDLTPSPPSIAPEGQGTRLDPDSFDSLDPDSLEFKDSPMTDVPASSSAAGMPDGWAYVPARDVLRILGTDAAIAAAWEQFVQAKANPSGVPGHAIVVSVTPRGTATPLLDLLRGAQIQPVRMSISLAASEKYMLLAPPAVVSQWREVSRQKDFELAIEHAAAQKLLNAANIGLKERSLAEAAYKKYGRGAANLRVRYRSRVTHCMNCRQPLDGEVNLLECVHCSAIVCPACGSCGCGDSRFARTT